MRQPTYEVVEFHADLLELGGVGEVVAGDDEQRGEVDARVLVRLHLEALAVPVDRLQEDTTYVIINLSYSYTLSLFIRTTVKSDTSWPQKFPEKRLVLAP